MTLTDLKTLLASHSSRSFRILLPDGGAVPQSFHVTEIGRVEKTFLDCGGTLRHTTACQLQVWIGPDHDHRLETGKLAAILRKAASILPDGDLPVEVEYEDRVISQYTISGHRVEEAAVVLELEHKHTACLAPELCGLPPLPGRASSAASTTARSGSACCGPYGCC